MCTPAVEAALDTGHELVFIVADDEDWPKDLYERLGFGPVGRPWCFTRPGPGTRRIVRSPRAGRPRRRQRLEQGLVQPPASADVEVAEEVVLDARRHGVGARQQPAALGRQPHDRAAPVGIRAAALDEARALGIDGLPWVIALAAGFQRSLLVASVLAAANLVLALVAAPRVRPDAELLAEAAAGA